MPLPKPRISTIDEPEANPRPASERPVARFEIRYYQYLRPTGELVGSPPALALDGKLLRRCYHCMRLTRQFDQKAVSLQRTGQLGTYASSLGQEAIGTALGLSMHQRDVLLPAYREYAAQFLRGVGMTDILLYWGGDERGMDYRIPREDFPISVPVASQASHAVGVAYAFKYRREPRVAVCVLGDGGTSKGDFYEALNLAGAWRLPVLFLVNNNQWAISVPRHQQSAAETLAQKAIAAGIAGEQVDGNDVVALYARLDRALREIRRRGQPLLIEALSYRLCDHTTADDASRYRDRKQLEQQRANDPLRRLKTLLMARYGWDEEQELHLLEECNEAVENAVKVYLETRPQPLESLFDYLYATLPEALEEQRAALLRRRFDA